MRMTFYSQLKTALFVNCSLSFLDEQAKEMVHKKGGQWSPLITYRNGLAGQDDEEEGTKNKQNKIQHS